MIERCILMTLILALAVTCQAALMPGDPDRVARAWEFTGADTEGWKVTNNLADFVVADGVLTTQAAGPDAHMAVSGVNLACAELTHLIIRMKTDAPGSTQIYFTTSASGDPAANDVPSFGMRADNEWHDYEVALTDLKGFSGTLGYLRIDPVNGGGESAHIAIDYIRLVQKAPRVSLVRFAPDQVWTKPGATVMLSLELASIGGSLLPELQAELAGVAGSVPVVLDTETNRYRATWQVEAPSAPASKWRVTVRTGEQVLLIAETCTLAVSKTALPVPSGRLRVAEESGWLLIETPVTQLAAPNLGKGYSIGVLRGRLPDGSWSIAGVCAPLATVAFQSEGILNWLAPSLTVEHASGATATLSADVPGSRATLELRPIADPSRIACTVRFGALSDMQVARLGGPTLLAGEGSFGEKKTTALFPGIEWLEGDQRSSDVTVVGEGVGYRPIPAPFQITVPLVAVEADGLLAGLMWAPLQDWGGEGMPMAEFASPNFLDGQANNLLAVFVPGWPQYGVPNQRSAAQSLELAAGNSLSFTTQLYALGGKTTNDAVPLWYATYGQPEPPTLVRPLSDYVGVIAQGWGQTCYYPELDKFVTHWRTGQVPIEVPGLKAEVYAGYLWTGDDRWITNIRLKPGTDLYSLAEAIPDDFGLGAAPAQIASQEADGSWLYHVTDDVKNRSEEFTGGKRHDLGEKGTSASGLIATNAVVVLGHAIATGNPISTEAGLKALEAIRRYKVPAGSQTWEVHKDTPDIYGAALLTDCFRMGYELTGDKSYLEDAIYWARTGLPFLYSYRVPGTNVKSATCVISGDSLTAGPDSLEGAHTSSIAFENNDRELSPYGSIPVFGTSFYVVNWMGNLVQWCGLVWAGSVQNLLRYVDDPILEKAAYGTLVSGCHQTFDREPLVGLLPDTWHLGSNTAYPALISPARLENPLLSALGLSYFNGAQLVVLRAEEMAPVRLATRGRQQDATLAPGKLAWTESYPAGAECEAAVLGLAQVTSVTVDAKALPQASARPLAGPSWYLDAATQRLFIRLQHVTEEARVEVGW